MRRVRGVAVARKHAEKTLTLKILAQFFIGQIIIYGNHSRWIAKGVVGGHVDVAERDLIHANPRNYPQRFETRVLILLRNVALAGFT